jgi:hypothetical protein
MSVRGDCFEGLVVGDGGSHLRPVTTPSTSGPPKYCLEPTTYDA